LSGVVVLVLLLLELGLLGVIEPLVAAPLLSVPAPVVAAALVLAPVEANAVPAHQSLLARCLGVAAR
jgi:hypothetical protein